MFEEDTGRWNINNVRNSFNHESVEAILWIKLLVELRKDELIWVRNYSKKLLVKSMYQKQVKVRVTNSGIEETSY